MHCSASRPAANALVSPSLRLLTLLTAVSSFLACQSVGSLKTNTPANLRSDGNVSGVFGPTRSDKPIKGPEIVENIHLLSVLAQWSQESLDGTGYYIAARILPLIQQQPQFSTEFSKAAEYLTTLSPIRIEATQSYLWEQAFLYARYSDDPALLALILQDAPEATIDVLIKKHSDLDLPFPAAATSSVSYLSLIDRAYLANALSHLADAHQDPAFFLMASSNARALGDLLPKISTLSQLDNDADVIETSDTWAHAEKNLDRREVLVGWLTENRIRFLRHGLGKGADEKTIAYDCSSLPDNGKDSITTEAPVKRLANDDQHRFAFLPNTQGPFDVVVPEQHVAATAIATEQEWSWLQKEDAILHITVALHRSTEANAQQNMPANMQIKQVNVNADSSAQTVQAAQATQTHTTQATQTTQTTHTTQTIQTTQATHTTQTIQTTQTVQTTQNKQEKREKQDDYCWILAIQ